METVGSLVLKALQNVGGGRMVKVRLHLAHRRPKIKAGFLLLFNGVIFQKKAMRENLKVDWDGGWDGATN